MSGQHTRTAIASSTCITLGVALAVSLGAIPRIADASGSTARAATPNVVGHAHHHAAPHVVTRAHVRHAAVTLPVAVTVVDAAAHTSTAPTTKQPVTKQPSKPASTPATKKHPKKAHHPKKTHKPVKPKPPAKAPRTTPSAAAVSSAISGLKQYVHTILTPSAAQVAEFGDQVCDAFDANQSFAHVKSVILAKVKQLPFTTVVDGAADYVVKTAVKLYCPAYKTKLS